MSVNENCCNTSPVTSNYKPKGTFDKVNDLEIYTTGSPKSQKTIIAFYDIFGFHNNTFQFCDLLAEAGYRVVVPDFFRGKAWKLDNFPPQNRDDFMAWIQKYPFDNHVLVDVLSVINFLNKVEPLGKISAIGFCWGGYMVVNALKREHKIFESGAILHPAFIKKEDLEAIKSPLLAVASNDEKNLVEDFKSINANVANQSEFHDFTDMHHGFASARGDFDNSNNRKRANDAINLITKFFNKVLA